SGFTAEPSPNGNAGAHPFGQAPRRDQSLVRGGWLGRESSLMRVPEILSGLRKEFRANGRDGFRESAALPSEPVSGREARFGASRLEFDALGSPRTGAGHPFDHAMCGMHHPERSPASAPMKRLAAVDWLLLGTTLPIIFIALVVSVVHGVRGDFVV